MLRLFQKEEEKYTFVRVNVSEERTKRVNRLIQIVVSCYKNKFLSEIRSWMWWMRGKKCSNNVSSITNHSKTKMHFKSYWSLIFATIMPICALRTSKLMLEIKSVNYFVNYILTVVWSTAGLWKRPHFITVIFVNIFVIHLLTFVNICSYLLIFLHISSYFFIFVNICWNIC